MERISRQPVSFSKNLIEADTEYFSFAAMAGMKIEKIQLNKSGAVDMKHLADLVKKHKDTLACGIVTYPSTSGVFEETIR